VGGDTRRAVESENPILDPDDKLACDTRGEVDLYVVFADGIPADLDMGVSTGVIRDENNENDDAECDTGCEVLVDEFDENLMERAARSILRFASSIRPVLILTLVMRPFTIRQLDLKTINTGTQSSQGLCMTQPAPSSPLCGRQWKTKS
jgi:hypothetical protein